MNVEYCSYDTMTEICRKWYSVSKRALEHNCEVTYFITFVETNWFRWSIWFQFSSVDDIDIEY